MNCNKVFSITDSTKQKHEKSKLMYVPRCFSKLDFLDARKAVKDSSHS